MKKLLLLLLAAFTFPNSVNSGIPENVLDKWVQISPAFFIDTEDIEIKKDKLRFYAERRELDGERTDPNVNYSWIGKIRIDCNEFESRIDQKLWDGFGGYLNGSWSPIMEDEISYTLANYFCYLTGAEGYTRETLEPEWVIKIINKHEEKQIEFKENLGNINCDSPVWKNKPRCNP